MEKRPTSSRRALRNAFFIFISRAIATPTQIGVFVVLARYLAVGELGRYGFILAFVTSVMGLGCLGIKYVVIREITRGVESRAALVGAGILLTLVLAGAGAAAVLVAALAAPSLRVGLGPLAVAVVAETLLAFGMLLRSVFQAEERMEYDPVLTAVQSAVLVLAIGAVVGLDLGFRAVFPALALSQLAVVVTGVYILLTRFTVPVFRINSPRLRVLIRDSLAVGLTMALYVNLSRLTVLLLEWLRGPEDVGVYYSAFRLVAYLEILPVSLLMGFYPALTRAASADRPDFNAMCVSVLRLAMAVAAPLGLCLWSLAGPVVSILFDARYAAAVDVLRVLSPFVVFLFLAVAVSQILIAMDRHRDVVVAALVSGGFNVGAAFWVIGRHGFVGAAVVTLATYVLFSLLGLWFMHRRGLRPGTWAVFGKPALSGGLAFVAIRAVPAWPAVGSLAVGLGVYLGIMLLVRAWAPPRSS